MRRLSGAALGVSGPRSIATYEWRVGHEIREERLFLTKHFLSIWRQPHPREFSGGAGR